MIMSALLCPTAWRNVSDCC